MFLNACSELDDLHGGRFRQQVHLRPIAYRDAGVLKRSVHNWTDGNAAWPHVIDRAPMLVYARNGMLRVCPTRDPLRYIEMGSPYLKIGGVWQQVNLPTPTRSGNRITWQTANADVICEFGGHLVHFGDVLLKGGWLPPSNMFAFPVGMSGLTRNGLTILADGAPVMALRQMHVTDLDNPLDVRSCDTRLVQVSGTWYVLCTLPDLTGMGPRRLVDPTLVLQPDAASGIDTTVISVDPDHDLSAYTPGYAYNNFGGGQYRNILIKFDLSGISPMATITTATLSLYVDSEIAWSTTGAISIAQILAINSAWVEMSTWNYCVPSTQRWAGDVGNDGGADAGCSVPDTDFSSIADGTLSWSSTPPAGTEHAVALTPARVQSLLTTNYGWQIRQTVSGKVIGYRLSDYITNITNRPKLAIDYTLPGGGNIFQSAVMHSAIYGGTLVR